MRRASRRKGAVLVAAIVVLFIVCMLAVQTTKTLSVIRYGDQRRSALRQSKELIELGRLVASQRKEQADMSEPFEITFGEDQRGKIGIFAAQEAKQVRIEVEYTQGNSPAIQASWEGETK